MVLELLLPAVNTGVPLTVLVTRPVLAPAKEPTAVEYPAKSNVPLSTKAELLDVALAAPTCNVDPLLIVVVPAYVLAAVKVTGADPAKVTAPSPPIAAGKVIAEVLLKLSKPLLVIVTALVGANPAIESP